MERSMVIIGAGAAGLTCPPKRYPPVVLDFLKIERGQHGQERVYTGTDHQ